jgi:hypothetical protein
MHPIFKKGASDFQRIYSPPFMYRTGKKHGRGVSTMNTEPPATQVATTWLIPERNKENRIGF